MYNLKGKGSQRLHSTAAKANRKSFIFVQWKIVAAAVRDEEGTGKLLRRKKNYLYKNKK